MDPPPTYQEILSEFAKSNKHNLELELQVQDLKQQLEETKQKLNIVNIGYTKAKKNEVLLTSLIQSSINA